MPARIRADDFPAIALEEAKAIEQIRAGDILKSATAWL